MSDNVNSIHYQAYKGDAEALKVKIIENKA